MTEVAQLARAAEAEGRWKVGHFCRVENHGDIMEI
jgi:hypothetical protein